MRRLDELIRVGSPLSESPLVAEVIRTNPDHRRGDAAVPHLGEGESRGPSKRAPLSVEAMQRDLGFLGQSLTFEGQSLDLQPVGGRQGAEFRTLRAGQLLVEALQFRDDRVTLRRCGTRVDRDRMEPIHRLLQIVAPSIEEGLLREVNFAGGLIPISNPRRLPRSSRRKSMPGCR